MSYIFEYTQNQTSQLDCKFEAPLVKGSIVETANDLITLEYNYPNKLVWVAEEKEFYFLRDDQPLDGSQLSHWRKRGGTASITPYDNAKTYLSGECVHYQRKIYSAMTDVPINTYPTDDTYWECIAGEIVSMKVDITGGTTIDTPEIDYPTAHVYDTNNMLVDCVVEMVTKNKIRLIFEVDSQETDFNGYVIIK